MSQDNKPAADPLQVIVVSPEADAAGSHLRRLEPGEPLPGCRTCGNLVACVCEINRQHALECRYRIAATLSFEFACDHGFQACPECDSCTCVPPVPVVAIS